jgi:hypothetical protein
VAHDVGEVGNHSRSRNHTGKTQDRNELGSRLL